MRDTLSNMVSCFLMSRQQAYTFVHMTYMCLQGGTTATHKISNKKLNTFRKLWISVRHMRLLTAPQEAGHHAIKSITHDTMLERVSAWQVYRGCASPVMLMHVNGGLELRLRPVYRRQFRAGPRAARSSHKAIHRRRVVSRLNNIGSLEGTLRYYYHATPVLGLRFNSTAGFSWGCMVIVMKGSFQITYRTKRWPSGNRGFGGTPTGNVEKNKAFWRYAGGYRHPTTTPGCGPERTIIQFSSCVYW